ncbi:apolipoprotein N-acyltransferase [Maricaulis sp.]|jgi:apolipoprotein N-acyltransferase|uniref:apolipoprotein N-acyltransferase n=1 Tax=Maricaulis sp. TaxID=1486257 RepID=UPI0025E27A2F|nr:apolipoprotein N-acyltransferase [Maricaulis sp.]MDF1767608.1 apolipoprotein N-acyltransferase [Maricaulis sp.]
MQRLHVLVWQPRIWLAAHFGWRPRLVIFLAGLFSALSLAPLHIVPALMLGLWVLFAALDGARRADKPLRSAFLRGFVFAFGYFLAGMAWVVYAFLTRGEGLQYAAPFALPALAALMAVFWGLGAVIYCALAPRSVWRVLVFAAALAFTEWLRGHVLGGLPWNLPAYVWPAGGLVSQTASWFGVYGLSLLTLFVLTAPLVAVTPRLELGRCLPAFAALAISTIVLATGAIRLAASAPEDVPGVTIRLVQAGIPQTQKWAPGGAELTRDRYLSLTGREGIEAVTHVVWPEGALPSFMLEDGATLARIGESLDEGQVLLAGVNRRAADGNSLRYYNTLAALRFPSGTPRIAALYDKVRLTPFGEFTPLSGALAMTGIPALQELARYEFTPGPGADVLDIPGAPSMLPLVCYEAIFPNFVGSAETRAGWIYNLSNDAWFGPTSGPRQHFNQASYRSIETGLPMVRSAALGVSGVVDSLGRARVTLDPSAEGVRDVALPGSLGRTPYSLWGDSPFLAFCILVLVGMAWQRFRLSRAAKHASVR